jgi:hypothetical protein
VCFNGLVPSPDAALGDGFFAARKTPPPPTPYLRYSYRDQFNCGGRGVKIFRVRPSLAALPVKTEM